MHGVLFSLFLVTGANPYAEPVEQPAYVEHVGEGCASCGSHADPCGHGCRGVGVLRGLASWSWDWWGPMPQTCYAPRFGCYPGNNRHMHRYPAFHGYYYREPYNYRHYFDYPWHAQPHEPLGYFAYRNNVNGGAPGGAQPIEAPPVGAVDVQPAPAPPMSGR